MCRFFHGTWGVTTRWQWSRPAASGRRENRTIANRASTCLQQEVTRRRALLPERLPPLTWLFPIWLKEKCRKTGIQTLVSLPCRISMTEHTQCETNISSVPGRVRLSARINRPDFDSSSADECIPAACATGFLSSRNWEKKEFFGMHGKPQGHGVGVGSHGVTVGSVGREWSLVG